MVEIEAAPPSLINHWTFDQTLEDDVGDNHGTFVGDVEPGFVEGFDGTEEGAVEFDGIDDVVTVDRTIQDEFTISLWVRTETPQRNDGPNFWQGSGLVYADVGGEHSDFGLAINGDVVNFGIGEPGDFPITGMTPVTTGDWVHVAAVRDIDEDVGATVLRIYVDGVLDGELEHPNMTPVDANPLITIGGNTIDTRMYTGEIDDVRFYNYVLDEDEINEIIEGDQPAGPRFSRGDANGDGSRNITDGVFILNLLFGAGTEPPCRDAADTNDDGSLNITDGVFILKP